MQRTPIKPNQTKSKMPMLIECSTLGWPGALLGKDTEGEHMQNLKPCIPFSGTNLNSLWEWS